MKTRVVSTRLTPEQAAELAKLAKENQLPSNSALLKILVKQFLTNAERLKVL